VFFRGQLLELMRWVARYCKNLPDDGNTFNDPTRRQNLVKAALIAGTLWGNRTYRDTLSGDADIAAMRRRALGAFRKGVEEANLSPHLGSVLGRGRALFTEHFPKHYPGFADAFERATKLTIGQYLGCLASLSIHILFNWKDGPMFVSHTLAAATTYKDVFPTFFALETQSPEELAMSFWDGFDTQGYRTLRDRPIMLTKDGRGMILDPTFYSEKIAIGPLFRLLKGANKQTADGIFSAFGYAFEDYAVDILGRMYPSRPGLVERLKRGTRGHDAKAQQFEIDASLLDATEAVILEMKAVFLREDALVADDHNKLLKHVRQKYGVIPEAKRERGKGVAQLARSVGAIVRGEWHGENNEFALSNVIYPVLVVHDTRLDAPALGNFLDEEFKSLLGPVPTGKRVAPLTIMTIHDLENLESSVGQFSFTQLLSDYSRECPDRIRSLHNYIAFSGYAKKINQSAHLMESSSRILELLQQELFPPSGPRDS
jgi:hypothetical protein